ncbi:GNAT family N-acetyltransferase [Burkholderia sp. Bp8963]|uniref:GNAT family N-acetyltransferase n=1 Tax=Burkholderia sp. Bp8963 TaxID=2184547 RepID=UPI000F5A50B5|nr:GNAT family N-acetyltransferase [Burkholderia sp. Bp8963]RQS65486.1 GNAT family N-acetyltransferase [Burkholderia sp. Bp8963]
MIRIANVGDAERLAELKRDTFRETFVEGFGIPYGAEDLAAYEAASYSPDVVRGQLLDPEHRTWVVEASDQSLVGYAFVGPCKLPHPEVKNGDGEICQIYLRRGAQGTGAGQSLLGLAIDFLAEKRPGPIWLGVWSGNEKAIAFYERAGFKRVGGYEFKVGSSTDSEFIYRR